MFRNHFEYYAYLFIFFLFGENVFQTVPTIYL